MVTSLFGGHIRAECCDLLANRHSCRTGQRDCRLCVRDRISRPRGLRNDRGIEVADRPLSQASWWRILRPDTKWRAAALVVPAWRASALARYAHGQRWISAADECFSTCNGLLNEARRFMQLADPLRLLMAHRGRRFRRVEGPLCVEPLRRIPRRRTAALGAFETLVAPRENAC
jgi:hypothetical protein